MPKSHWNKSHSCSSTGHEEAQQGVYQHSACRADGAIGEARVLYSSVPSAGVGGSSAATRTEQFTSSPGPYQPICTGCSRENAILGERHRKGARGWRALEVKGCLGTSTDSSHVVAAVSPTRSHFAHMREGMKSSINVLFAVVGVLGEQFLLVAERQEDTR